MGNEHDEEIKDNTENTETENTIEQNLDDDSKLSKLDMEN